MPSQCIVIAISEIKRVIFVYTLNKDLLREEYGELLYKQSRVLSLFDRRQQDSTGNP